MAKIKPEEATFTDALRGRVVERLTEMISEGDRKGSEGPQAAREIGIAYSTLWRFLWRRKGLSSEATDKVMAWLSQSP